MTIEATTKWFGWTIRKSTVEPGKQYKLRLPIIVHGAHFSYTATRTALTPDSVEFKTINIGRFYQKDEQITVYKSGINWEDAPRRFPGLKTSFKWTATPRDR